MPVKPRYFWVALLATLRGTLFERWAAELINREVDRLLAAVQAARDAAAIDIKAKGTLAIPVLSARRAQKAMQLAHNQAVQQAYAWQLQAQMMGQANMQQAVMGGLDRYAGSLLQNELHDLLRKH